MKNTSRDKFMCGLLAVMTIVINFSFAFTAIALSLSGNPLKVWLYVTGFPSNLVWYILTSGLSYNRQELSLNPLYFLGSVLLSLVFWYLFYCCISRVGSKLIKNPVSFLDKHILSGVALILLFLPLIIFQVFGDTEIKVPPLNAPKVGN